MTKGDGKRCREPVGNRGVPDGDPDPAGAEAGDLFDQDRTKLATDLDACRARERELAEAGVQASEALAKAIEELRVQLGPESA